MQPKTDMNPKQTPPHPASGLNSADVLYILFRRKWVILGFSLLGFAGAGLAFKLMPLKYQSAAELLITYVPAPTIYGPTGVETQIKTETTGPTILNSEISIIKSYDVARSVTDTIGPARILGISNSATNSGSRDAAATLVQEYLNVELVQSSEIIRLTFSHRDRAVAQSVLEQVIEKYKDKHYYIHHGPPDPLLITQTEELQARLKSEENEIAKVKSQGGVVDVASATAALSARELGLEQDISMILAELDQSTARRDTLQKMIPPEPGQVPATNANLAKEAPPTEDEKEAYQKVRDDLAKLLTDQAALRNYTTNYPQVQTNLIEIAAAQARKKALEKANPGLLTVAAAVESRATGVPPAPDPVAVYKTDYNNEVTKISGLQARFARQTNELERVKSQEARLIDTGVTLHDLERAKDADETELKNLQLLIAKLNMDDQRGADRVSGINISESPTPPVLEVKKFSKLIGGIAVAGVALGLVLAFVLEMLVDRSLRRPQEAVSKLPFPFFISVPYLNGQSKWNVFHMGGRKNKLLTAGAETASLGTAETKALAPAHAGPVAPWSESHAMRPYHETLRDRLIAYFEMINLTHKPKLVAVTGCHHGAGVSTVASGLASSLSETGEGNVLLVNMNEGNGEAHHFYKGKLNMGLDDILEKQKDHREIALVQDNLYVVKESSNADKLPSVLPRRFGHLVTQLKASDYDYIIFDMPPVTQISITPRLARFMDMVMLVVESEKTDRDAAQRAAALLSQSRSNVGVVMNKSRTYVPQRLQHEI
jgi:Mrp family chromosome partitioning ATPase/uncharacterized protein involved in exopolysaccharide biosynthesis